MRHKTTVQAPETSRQLIQREIDVEADKTDLSYYLPSIRPQRMASLKQSWSYLAYYHPTPGPFARFTSGHFPPKTTTQKHNHSVIAMHGSLQGPLTLLTPEGGYELDSGDFCMIGPGVDHHWFNEGPHTASTIAFLIDLERLGEWPEQSGVAEACRELETLVKGVECVKTAGNPDLQHAFWRMADQLIAEHPHRMVDITSRLLLFLSLILNHFAPTVSGKIQDDVAQRIRRLLINRVNDRLTIPEVAREVHVSPTLAKTAFRKTYGCGIMAYFNEIKIWQAKRMLSDPTLTVDQVSRKLGFSSPAYFTRAFRKLSGETPSSFRSKRFPSE
ncbi:AraC family transcriptional regulator [uncultured Gimesia sp.]|jgi:AraC-like DNA-binding protein/quercetin dioxygenase-like cupin family protein|uniref:helix-turn-helix domain-containing protein n=1 Tax=uncultured Gimesia sp. TaxID=1678688 RepID=UPI002616AC72|nr:AraC family transcriptional regulator [uncultured Gimesia sp.]